MMARGNKRLRVSGKKKMEETMIATNPPRPSEEIFESFGKITSDILMQHAKLRMAGSGVLGLTYVAAGKYDAFFDYTLEPWDIAAGLLMVKEAGGNIIDIETGSEKDKDIVYSGKVLAANDGIFEKVRKIIK